MSSLSKSYGHKVKTLEEIQEIVGKRPARQKSDHVPRRV